MMYCLGIKLDAGWCVRATRAVTAGIDYISTYRPPPMSFSRPATGFS